MTAKLPFAVLAVLLGAALVCCQGREKKERVEPGGDMVEGNAEITDAPRDIIGVAVEDGSFRTLLAALRATGLAETLKGEGPFTLFAPTDDAFLKLPRGTMEALIEDPPRLRSILLGHVVYGKLTAADMVARPAATTASGETVRFKLENGKLFVNGAKIIIPDIEASNGVIHMMGAVLMPPEQ
jgi:uncharacterized surface protein with fasciclin (FAS1) repeats